MILASIEPPGSNSRENPAALQRLQLEACLNDIIALACIETTSVKWLQEKLSEESFNLVAAGQFKRGKSTAINALIGESLLPTGVVPLTSVVTVIRSGPHPAAAVELRDGQRIAIPLRELADYVTERGNPGNTRGILRVLIEHPSSWLASGVRLVDTPGIGSVYEHNTDETLKYLPQADAIIFIASVDQPLSRPELDFLRAIRPYAAKIFCLLNKIDYLRPDELPEALAFATRVLEETLGPSVPIFPVSARLALQTKESQSTADGPTSGGFTAFEKALRRFIDTDKRDAWLRSIAHTLQRLLSQGRFAVDLELKLSQEPLERIEANLALFREERERASRARLDHQVLLTADARRLLKDDVEPKLDAFKREQQGKIAVLIETWAAEMRGLPVRKIQAELERRVHAHIRSAYDGWLAELNGVLSRAFEDLCARFWSNLQSTADALMQRSSELFGVNFAPIRSDSHWRTQSQFYYKFWYEPTSLMALSSSILLLLPRLISMPILIGRSTRDAVDLIEVQAGRIRHDLEERLRQSVHDAQRQMVDQIDAAIAGIEAAIDNGTTLRQRSAEYAEVRQAQLASMTREIELLRARLQRLIG